MRGLVCSRLCDRSTTSRCRERRKLDQERLCCFEKKWELETLSHGKRPHERLKCQRTKTAVVFFLISFLVSLTKIVNQNDSARIWRVRVHCLAAILEKGNQAKEFDVFESNSTKNKVRISFFLFSNWDSVQLDDHVIGDKRQSYRKIEFWGSRRLRPKNLMISVQRSIAL